MFVNDCQTKKIWIKIEINKLRNIIKEMNNKKEQ